MSMLINVCLFVCLFLLLLSLFLCWMNCACGHQTELKSSFSILSRVCEGGGHALKGGSERFLATYSVRQRFLRNDGIKL